MSDNIQLFFKRNPDIRTIIDTVLDGLIIINDQGEIQEFNNASIKIFGYETDEIIGKNVTILMPPPYNKEHNQYIHNYVNTQNPKVIGIGREVFGKRKNGEIFPMEIGVNKIEINDGFIFVGTIRDNSARTNAERKVNSYIEALKHSNQDLDDFAYIASHDLKEPLRGLANNALFLKEDYKNLLDEGAIKRIDRMIFLCERMEKLINDLLYFSKLGHQTLAIKTVNLNDVIEDVLSMMESTLIDENVKILIPEKLPNITCNELGMTEVFRNLITNAIKYNNKKEKCVEIGFKFSDLDHEINKYILYVKDNGIGIAKEHYYDIFRIFKRLNDESDVVKGTGVGLTFVKKIIERHSGKIWLESEINSGTTFYFIIGDYVT